jgi:hypothetical protein
MRQNESDSDGFTLVSPRISFVRSTAARSFISGYGHNGKLAAACIIPYYNFIITSFALRGYTWYSLREPFFLLLLI